MNRLDSLLLEIENLREKMHDMIKEDQSITSPKIIITSQKLDKLLIEYNILKEGKSK